MVEFFAFGPADRDAPARIVKRLRAAIEARNSKAWPQLFETASRLKAGYDSKATQGDQSAPEAETATAVQYLRNPLLESPPAHD